VQTVTPVMRSSVMGTGRMPALRERANAGSAIVPVARAAPAPSSSRRRDVDASTIDSLK
jgi:hypothetical protein